MGSGAFGLVWPITKIYIHPILFKVVKNSITIESINLKKKLYRIGKQIS